MGVPGELAGLWEAHQRSGKVAWAELVGIVREVADNGFTVSAQLAKTLKEHEGKIKGDLGLRYVLVLFHEFGISWQGHSFKSVFVLLQSSKTLRGEELFQTLICR